MPAHLSASILLLADSRLPAGAHAHSGGVAAAVTAGTVHDEPTLEDFLTGRLLTSGFVAAAAASRAAVLLSGTDPGPGLADLDAQLDARTPSPAAREASRAQGRGLARVVGAAWPVPALALIGPRPHLAVAIAAAALAVGAGPDEAAALAALGAINGPAAAAVRLLGLDPLRVSALLARVGPLVDGVAERAVAGAGCTELPTAASGPLLDLLAQAHSRATVRLFAS